MKDSPCVPLCSPRAMWTSSAEPTRWSVTASPLCTWKATPRPRREVSVMIPALQRWKQTTITRNPHDVKQMQKQWWMFIMHFYYAKSYSVVSQTLTHGVIVFLILQKWRLSIRKISKCVQEQSWQEIKGLNARLSAAYSILVFSTECPLSDPNVASDVRKLVTGTQLEFYFMFTTDVFLHPWPSLSLYFQGIH